MKIMDTPLIIIGKLISLISKLLGFGAGATWPGEIALKLNPAILRSLTVELREGVIIVAGTNGKTTTSFMIKKILEHEGKIVVHNASGANLLNGVISAFIHNASWSGKINADWGVLEIDENSLSLVLNEITSHSRPATKCGVNSGGNPEKDKPGSPIEAPGMTRRLIIVLLNLFRDQLDRYGEVDVIAEKWGKALRQQYKQGQQESKTENQIQIVANADDPLIAHMALSLRDHLYGQAISKNKLQRLPRRKTPRNDVTFFGVDDPSFFLKKIEHATDSTFCLNCGRRLNYQGIYFSHLGVWSCKNCGEKRPVPHISKWKSPLPGLYNLYNTLAAVSVAKNLNITDKDINNSLRSFVPAFGRQEEFEIGGKKVKIFLSKNPAGFNASLRTVLEFKPKVILLALNDRIPDGRDVSWIWDVDFEMADDKKIKIIASGDRVYDLALRIKYAELGQQTTVEPDLSKALHIGLSKLAANETLFILATYSAMLETRKILAGRKIL